MKVNKHYAVITGDIVGSSKIEKGRKRLLNTLKKTFTEITSEMPGTIEKPFEIFRGDSFQGIINQTEKTLLISIILRAKLRGSVFNKTSKNNLDARIAIGIGGVGFNTEKVIESDGEAFNFSGKLLDEIEKGEQNLKIRTTWPEINEELQVESYFIDSIINKWTAEQAEVIYLKLLKNLTQQTLAKKLRISQPAVRKRLIAGNLKSIELFIERFEKLIISKV